MLGNGDNSIYNGLQVTFRQRTREGLYFVGGYTWAHSIDDSSGNREFVIQDSTILPLSVATPILTFATASR